MRPTTLPTDARLGLTTFFRSPGLQDAIVVYAVRDRLVIRETAPGAEAPTERRYARSAVETIAFQYAGRAVTVKRVVDDIRFGLLEIDLEARGPRLAYAVKDALLILAAMGICRVDASSAEHCYTIDPLRESH